MSQTTYETAYQATGTELAAAIGDTQTQGLSAAATTAKELAESWNTSILELFAYVQGTDGAPTRPKAVATLGSFGKLVMQYLPVTIQAKINEAQASKAKEEFSAGKLKVQAGLETFVETHMTALVSLAGEGPEDYKNRFAAILADDYEVDEASLDDLGTHLTEVYAATRALFAHATSLQEQIDDADTASAAATTKAEEATATVRSELETMTESRDTLQAEVDDLREAAEASEADTSAAESMASLADTRSGMVTFAQRYINHCVEQGYMKASKAEEALAKLPDFE